MHHLFVAAHPRLASFTMTAARTCCEELRALRHEPVLHDLYRTGFDPVLSASELAHGPAATVPRAIAEEQAEVARADVLIFLYPLW